MDMVYAKSSHPSGLYSTSKLYEEVSQKYMISLSVTMYYTTKHAPITSRCIPSYQLTEEEKIRVWFTEGSSHYAGTTQSGQMQHNNPEKYL